NLLAKEYKIGTSQKAALKDIITQCYAVKGIFDEKPNTWKNAPPTFSEVEEELSQRLEEAESARDKQILEGLGDKLSDVFTYGIFSKPQPDIFSPRLVRIDLSLLAKVEGLQAIAVNSLAKQLLDKHRILGTDHDEPRYLMVDESRTLANSQQANNIIRDGRKYKLSIGLFSQSERDLSADAVSNASTLMVLGVTPSDLKKVASKFRFSENKIANLNPLEALVRMGKEAHYIRIIPFFERIKYANPEPET
ncbi:MAG: ATP-binding protein, partial [Xenococcaceae cyanobacterium]